MRSLVWLPAIVLGGCDAFFSPPPQVSPAEIGEVAPRDVSPTDPNLSANSTAEQRELIGRVVRVADGDTLTIADSAGRQHNIRLVGIDAPELKQAFGKQSRQALSRMAMGKNARVLWTEKDQFGRTLGIVYVGDLNANAELVRNGWAWRYKHARSAELSAAESAARQERAGLWSDTNPIPPWDYRRQEQRNSRRR